MTHVVVSSLTDEVKVQPKMVVSKVLYRDEQLDVTMFGFDAGEGLSEHEAGKTAVVEVLSGRLRFTADSEVYDAGPGFWLRMAPHTPHSLIADEATLMLLTLL